MRYGYCLFVSPAGYVVAVIFQRDLGQALAAWCRILAGKTGAAEMCNQVCLQVRWNKKYECLKKSCIPFFYFKPENIRLSQELF
jgi:hypothetical protein